MKWALFSDEAGQSRHRSVEAPIRESPPQFENRIMARVYVRNITHSVPKSSILLAGTGVWKNSYVVCGFSSIKIDYSYYPKSLMSRINEDYVVVFFNKISL